MAERQWLSQPGCEVSEEGREAAGLGDKRDFIELRKQKGLYVIPCENPSSSLFPLTKKELNLRNNVDKDGVVVEEDRPAKVKSAPVLPTVKETRTRGHACDVPQLVRGVCCSRRRSQAFVE